VRTCERTVSGRHRVRGWRVWRYLKSLRPDVVVRGVDTRREYVDEARRVLDDASWAQRQPAAPEWPRPDCLVFADVLEHLADPWSVLKRWACQLQVGGTVIVSVPNVAHRSVVFPLLLGRWTYRKTESSIDSSSILHPVDCACSRTGFGTSTGERGKDQWHSHASRSRIFSQSACLTTSGAVNRSRDLGRVQTSPAKLDVCAVSDYCGAGPMNQTITVTRPASNCTQEGSAPDVSVIVVNYNGAHLLERCLRSVKVNGRRPMKS